MYTVLIELLIFISAEPLTPQSTLEGHTAAVQQVTFSKDGKTLASASMDKTVKTWDMSTKKCITTLQSRDSVRCVAFSPIHRRLACGGGAFEVYLWDLDNPIQPVVLRQGGSDAVSLAFSPDGKTLALGSGSVSVSLWDVTTGRRKGALRSHAEDANVVVYSLDGKTIATGSVDKTIKLWDAETGKNIVTIMGNNDWVADLAFSPDGKLIASCCKNSLSKISTDDHMMIKLWDTVTGKQIAVLVGHEDAVTSIAFSTNGKYLASGSRDRTIKLWDMSTRKVTNTIKAHADRVNSVAFSQDCKTLASGSADRTIKLWNIAQ